MIIHFVLLILIYWYYKLFLVYNEIQFKSYRYALEVTYQTFGGKSFSIQMAAKSIQTDLYFLMHPDVVEEDFYINRNFPHGDRIFRKLFYSRTRQNLPKQQLKDVGFVFRQYVPQSVIMKFSIFQYFGAIPYKAHLHEKSWITKTHKEYLDLFQTQNQSNECMKNAQFLKQSYDIQHTKDCLEVLKILKKKQYLVNGKPVKYLLKYNRHRQKGVFFLDEEKAKELLRKMHGRKDCTKHYPLTVQEFIHNPVLLMKRAFTFRVYVLVASVHSPIVYIFERTMLQVCLRPWNSYGARDPLRHLCNAALSKEYFLCLNDKHDDPKLECPYYPDVASLEERVPSPWLANITTMLMKQGLVKDRSWQETYFYPKIMSSIALLLNKRQFHQDPRESFLWYGVDFEIDRDRNVWLLDFNTGPSLAITTKENYDMLKILYRESFRIMQYFQKQKYRKIKNFFDQELIQKLEDSPSQAEISKLVLKGTALKDEKKQFTYFRQLDLTQYPKGCIRKK